MTDYKNLINDIKKNLSGELSKSYIIANDESGAQKVIKTVSKEDKRRLIAEGPGIYYGEFKGSSAIYETDGVILKISFTDYERDIGFPCISIYDTDGAYLSSEY